MLRFVQVADFVKRILQADGGGDSDDDGFCARAFDAKVAVMPVKQKNRRPRRMNLLDFAPLC